MEEKRLEGGFLVFSFYKDIESKAKRMVDLAVSWIQVMAVNRCLVFFFNGPKNEHIKI